MTSDPNTHSRVATSRLCAAATFELALVASRPAVSEPRAANATKPLLDAVHANAAKAARDAGGSNVEIVGFIAHIEINTLINCVNEVLETEIDFPRSRWPAA